MYSRVWYTVFGGWGWRWEEIPRLNWKQKLPVVPRPLLFSESFWHYLWFLSLSSWRTKGHFLFWLLSPLPSLLNSPTSEILDTAEISSLKYLNSFQDIFSPLWRPWVWVNSRSWLWTGRPGVLQFTESQRVRHNWATELNWRPFSLYKEFKNWLLEMYFNLIIRIYKVFFHLLFHWHLPTTLSA